MEHHLVPGLAAVVCALAGCGQAVKPPAVAAFEPRLASLASGEAEATGPVQKILAAAAAAESGAADPGDDLPWRDRIRARDLAEQKLWTLFSRGRAQLRETDREALTREPEGRRLYAEFCDRLEALAVLATRARPELASWLEALDDEAGKEAGLGGTVEAVRRTIDARVTALDERVQGTQHGYLEERLELARLCKLAGAAADCTAAAQKARAFLKAHELEEHPAFADVLEQATKLTP